MFTAYVVITLLAIDANAFSGVAAIVHFKPILPGMARAGVPVSWLTFPIGTLKTAGAAGLLLGLAGVPLVGTAAAIGLVLFFVYAVHTHLLARDYSPQFGLAIGTEVARRVTIGTGGLPGGPGPPPGEATRLSQASRRGRWTGHRLTRAPGGSRRSSCGVAARPSRHPAGAAGAWRSPPR
jgi:DoxX-like family